MVRLLAIPSSSHHQHTFTPFSSPFHSLSPSIMAPAQSGEDVKWGRVAICGGTDWPRLGRKDRKSEDEETSPDLLEPHILRSLTNVQATAVYSSHSACNFIVIDVDGQAWTFGRYNLGPGKETIISENAPQKWRVHEDLGAPKGTKIVHAACGRNHSLMVGSNGQVWSMGINTLGQCGRTPCPDIPKYKPVDAPWIKNGDKAVMVGAGITFSAVLTESGKVYTFGSGEKGQLGNGTTGERITTGNKTAYDVEPYPLLVKELQDKKIVQISCGQQHVIALDDAGLVYVWGYNGYCRLGLGNQVDILKPKVVPQFSGGSVTQTADIVTAGPTNSVVVDKQGMYWMAGKWKNSGEGSSGSPYSSFRYIQDVMGCRMTLVACGGVTHWGLVAEDDGIMTVAWGQNAANGELGLGNEQPKSATKPTKHEPLSGIEVIGIAPSQNSTIFLAVPSDKFSELPRHPEDVDASQHCKICSEDDRDDSDTSLQCDKCDDPYHLRCLNPPLSTVPEGEWFCRRCYTTPGAPIGHVATRKPSSYQEQHGQAGGRVQGTGPPKRGAVAKNGSGAGASKKKRKAVEEDEEEEDWRDDDDDDYGSGKKKRGGDDSDESSDGEWGKRKRKNPRLFTSKRED
ncbi:RCC1/BLIP-II [Pterulicium gracile]|uniref:RCC1/BLIP-II n=1 Tax=Pterulicium gracile TaxID=1884261 RepID=A0A5C3Q4S8_9AGAR|nr:RCC1/BLIP-II [Pterula gracilis]